MQNILSVGDMNEHIMGVIVPACVGMNLFEVLRTIQESIDHLAALRGVPEVRVSHMTDGVAASIKEALG